MAHELVVSHGTDPEGLASGSNRGQEPSRLVGDEDEDVPIGRLLEHLQQRVLDLLVGLVGMLDEDHPALAGDRGPSRVEKPATRHRHDALPRRARLSPAVRRADQQVRMDARSTIAAAATGVARPLGRVGIGAEGEREEVVDERRLAGSARAVHEERPGGSATVPGAQREPPRRGLADAEEAGGGRLDHGLGV